MHVLEMGVMGLTYLLVVVWVLSNLADDKEVKTQRDFENADKKS